MSISTVTSEALQLKLRQLLPSQQGFGTDLSASDTIIPIIDLTAAAEGSDVPELLQTALAFGSQTVFSVSNATDTVANTAGFYRIIGTSSARSSGSVTIGNVITINDGSSVKNIWGNSSPVDTADNAYVTMFDFVLFLRAGDSCEVISDNSQALCKGSIRQIADVNGVLVQPVGFTPQ